MSINDVIKNETDKRLNQFKEDAKSRGLIISEMDELYFSVTDDKCIRSTHLPQFGDYVYEETVVITKEAFIECFNKWIKKEESDDT